MDAATIKWLVTALIAVVSAIFAVVNYKRQSKTKIYFFEQQKINLYDDIVKNIGGLKITYNGVDIGRSMFLLKGIFICAGNKDITKPDVNKGIMINLISSKSKWLDFKIINKTKSFEIVSIHNENSIQVDFNLMKDGDYFIIECIGEADNSAINFDHRIANVEKIKHNDIGVNTHQIGNIIFGLLVLVLGGILSYQVNPFQKISPGNLVEIASDGSELNVDMSKVKSLDSLYRVHTVLTWTADSLIKLSSDSSLRMSRRIVDVDLAVIDAQMDTIRAIDNRRFRVFHSTDSILNVAASEYSEWQLWFDGETRKYHIPHSREVSFRLYRTHYWLYSVPFGLLVLGLLYTVRGALGYLQYRRVGEIAVKKLSEYKTDSL